MKNQENVPVCNPSNRQITDTIIVSVITIIVRCSLIWCLEQHFNYLKKNSNSQPVEK